MLLLVLFKIIVFVIVQWTLVASRPTLGYLIQWRWISSGRLFCSCIVAYVRYGLCLGITVLAVPRRNDGGMVSKNLYSTNMSWGGPGWWEGDEVVGVDAVGTVGTVVQLLLFVPVSNPGPCTTLHFTIFYFHLYLLHTFLQPLFACVYPLPPRLLPRSNPVIYTKFAISCNSQQYQFNERLLW